MFHLKRFFCAALVFALLFSGCAPKSDTPAPPDETPTSSAAPTPSTTPDPALVRHQTFTKSIKAFDRSDALISLTLTRTDGTVCDTFTDTWQNISFGDYAWNETTSPDDVSERSFFELYMADTDYSLCIYEGINSVRLTTADGVMWFTPTLREYESEMYYAWLSKYESAQYALAQRQAGIDPDAGYMTFAAAELSYLDAAAKFVQASIDARLSLPPENPRAWSYGSFTVFPAEEETEYSHSIDFIKDNQQYYTFEIIYTPLSDSYYGYCSGDDKDYDGSDPNVPDGSKTNTFIGVVTLDGGDWRVSGYATGW